MKNYILIVCVVFISLSLVKGQSLDELKTMKSDKQAMIDDHQSKINAAQAEIDDLQTQIDVLSGWRTGFSGLLGFDWLSSNGWAANPNPDASSSSLGLNLTGHALMDKEKFLWHNKGIINKAWQDVKLNDEDDDGLGLFDKGTVDILNISSLAGHKVSPKLAITGLGELNTSLGNFLSPGTLDIGVGATWLPIQNMTVVIHPFNYHVAFSGVDGVSSEGSIGTKIRMDYFKDFNLAGKKMNWTTTLTSFIPYKGAAEGVPSVFEYTWLNTLSFEIWKGIGVGLGWGLRKSDFESEDTQSYTSLGLSYGF